MLLTQFAEGNKKFVVNNTGVIQKGPNNCLDARYAVFVKGWAVVWTSCILYLPSIDDGRVLVGRVLGLRGEGMVLFDSEIGDVITHGEAAGAGYVVPIEVDA